MRKLLLLCGLVAALGCSPNRPDPVVVASPPPTGNTCIISGTGNTCNVGNGAPPAASPSPSPSAGPFVKPDYVKITQFGETCGTDKNGVQIVPSGQDRSVRIGCTKALTLSPKCHQTNGGPDIDCPVPDNAAPDSFEVTEGQEHIIFSPFGSLSVSPALRAALEALVRAASIRAFSDLHALSDAFNRRATGVSVGFARITGSYAGVRAQDDFILTVIQ
jgi:hypothetical protein